MMDRFGLTVFNELLKFLLLYLLAGIIFTDGIKDLILEKFSFVEYFYTY